MTDRITSSRFIVRSERPPTPRPTGWRRMFEVVDTGIGGADSPGTSLQDGFVVKRFWHWGEADCFARSLNSGRPAA